MQPQIIVNVLHTQYSVVKEVMKDIMHFSLSAAAEGEWDLLWADAGMTAEILARMKPYQKVNHFPNMSCLARKNHLGRNLMRMRKAFPKDYNFFPQTWMLPLEWNSLRAELAKGGDHIYILKPEALSQGKGIFLTRNFENVGQNDRYVVQRYLRRPYLIDGLKFDLRIYVLVYGCDPLRIYIYKEGLARLATAKYEGPNADNIDNLYMHLTNYAINKMSKDFVFNSDADRADVGHKRSLDFVWRYIDANGGNSRSLRRKIKRCIVKTLCAVQPQLSRTYRSCQPNDTGNNMCFEVLGFDIILDHKLKPWLLEVNHAPSFTTDTPFDHKVKAELLSDTVRLLHMNPVDRIQHYQQKQEEFDARAMGRAAHERVTKEEREEMRKEAMELRDKYEMQHLGGYTRIYPDDKSKIAGKCAAFIAFAESALDQFYGLNKKPAPAKRPSTAATLPRGKSIQRPRVDKRLGLSTAAENPASEKKELRGRVLPAQIEPQCAEKRASSQQRADLRKIYGATLGLAKKSTVFMKVREKENDGRVKNTVTMRKLAQWMILR